MEASSGKSLMVDIRQVKVTKARGRKDFGDLEGLSVSIKRHGLIHPIVVSSLPDGNYELIAGERRLKACFIAGLTQVSVMFRDELPALARKEIELEENVRRQNLVWQEEISILRQIDDIKREIHGEKLQGQSGEGWTLEKTAALVGKSIGQVSEDINLAKLLEERPDIAKRVETLPKSAAAKKAKAILETEDVERQIKAGVFSVDSDLREGDARELIKKLEPASVDLLLTDPPYGIAVLVENLGDARESHLSYMSAATATDNLDLKTASRLVWDLAPELFRVLKPSSHFYIFHCAELYSPLLAAMQAAGFIVDFAPLVWDKQMVTGPFLGYSYQGCYEPILFGHKPPRAKRLAGPMKSILQAKALVRSKLHPFHKSPEIIRILLGQSSKKGDLVLDPFAGSAEVLLTARASLRRAIGFELNHEHFLVGQGRLREQATEPVESFESLQPGTKEWIRHWTDHPEDQEEMLELAKKLALEEKK